MHSTRRAVILASVVCALALSLAVPLRNYVAQRQELSTVLAENDRLAAQVEELPGAAGSWAARRGGRAGPGPAGVRAARRDALHRATARVRTPAPRTPGPGVRRAVVPSGSGVR